ncbi:hypothetical protein NL676_037253 [Syzygium grande]|nr:hypothetical protein NL676_037253 [Syzygium grande]
MEKSSSRPRPPPVPGRRRSPKRRGEEASSVERRRDAVAATETRRNYLNIGVTPSSDGLSFWEESAVISRGVGAKVPRARQIVEQLAAVPRNFTRTV